MSDPLSLAAVGGIVLAEGIRFLYGQATELLRRRRERADQPASPPRSQALDGELGPVTPDMDIVTREEQTLRALRTRLADYADGLADVDRSDPRLLADVDALRRLLELVYGQRITFRGEERPPSGDRIDVTVVAGEVEGYLAGVRARLLDTSRGMSVRTTVDTVAAGGEAVGIDVDEIR